MALSKKGGAYLKDLKKSGACELTIITNMSKENLPEEIRYGVSRDILASDIYNLLCERDTVSYTHLDVYKRQVMNIDEEKACLFDESLERLQKETRPSQEEFYILSNSFL